MKFSFIILMFASLFLLNSCTKKNDNEILIGHFGSMTGAEATFGQSTDAGARLAIDEVNEAGGVMGKKLVLKTMDDQGKPEDAASVVTRLIDQDEVMALIGEVASSRSLAAAPIAQARKVPMLTPSSTNPKVTEVGDYIFRVCFIDPFQGTVMAKFAYNNLKLRKVAIMRDMKSDYSVGLSDYFTQKFKELGGEIVGDVSYQSGDVDFKAQLTQLKSKQPDGLYVPGYYTEVGLLARQAHELGLKIPLMGGDGWDSEKLSEIGQDAVNGSYFSTHYSNESTEPVVLNFVNRYKRKYGATPNALAAQAYDAIKVLAHAMKNSTNLSRKTLREQLTLIKDFRGVTGNITIDENRNARKSAVVVRVEGKANKYVTTIDP